MVFIFFKKIKKLKPRKPSNASACEWAEDVQTTIELRKMAGYGGTHLGPRLREFKTSLDLERDAVSKKKFGENV